MSPVRVWRDIADGAFLLIGTLWRASGPQQHNPQDPDDVSAMKRPAVKGVQGAQQTRAVAKRGQCLAEWCSGDNSESAGHPYRLGVVDRVNLVERQLFPRRGPFGVD